MSEQIIIEYKADIEGLKAQLKTVESGLKKVETAGKESAQSINKEFKNTGASLKEGFKDIAISLGLAFGVEKIIDFGKESIKAFSEAEANANKLKFALTKIGGEGTLAFKKLIEQSEKLQKSTIFSDDAIQQSQTALSQFGLTSDQIEKLIPQIADLASATGDDLATATQKAIQGINGQTRGLKSVGIQFADTGSKTQNLALLTEKLTKFQGASAEALETTAGKAKRLENAFDDIKEKIGEYLVNEGNAIIDNFETVFGGKGQEIATRKSIETALKLQNEYNQKNAEKIKSGEKSKAQVIADNSKYIEELYKQRGQQENYQQQLNIDAQIKNLKSFNEELRNLGKERSIIDDATLGGNKDANKAKEDALKAKQDTLDALNELDVKADQESLKEQAKTDEQKLTLARSEALKEVDIAYQKAIDAGNAESDATLIAQNTRSNINKSFDDQEADLKLKRYNDSADKLNAEIDKDEADALTIKKKASEEAIKQAEKEAKRKEELNKQLVSALKSGLDAIAGVSSNITEQQIQDNDKKTDKEIKNLDRELSQKLITQEEHDRKVAELEKAKDEKQRQLKKKQFETDRQIAIVKIIIATAEAVITQFAETGYYGAILAGVVGAAELAVVASQPTPQFEKGGKVKGKRHHSGGTLIEAEKDEWIINRTEAMKNDKMLKAINDGQGDKYIFDHYIAPALKQQQKKLSESKDKSFANNLAMSMGLNFKDSNLLDSLKQSRKNDREIALFLAKELKPNTRDARRF